MTNFWRCNQILLPSTRHLEERLTVSQSVSQAGNQTVRQSVWQTGRQTGKQASRNRQVADYDYKHWGNPSVQEHSVVKWSNTWPMNRLAPIRIPVCAIGD